MRDSISDRIKITKTGKLLRRRMAQGHFRAKKKGRQIRRKRKGLSLRSTNAKIFKKYLGAK